MNKNMINDINYIIDGLRKGTVKTNFKTHYSSEIERKVDICEEHAQENHYAGRFQETIDLFLQEFKYEKEIPGRMLGTVVFNLIGLQYYYEAYYLARTLAVSQFDNTAFVETQNLFVEIKLTMDHGLKQASKGDTALIKNMTRQIAMYPYYNFFLSESELIARCTETCDKLIKEGF